MNLLMKKSLSNLVVPLALSLALAGGSTPRSGAHATTRAG